MSQTKRTPLQRIIGEVSAMLLALLLIAVFYVSVIMAQPPESEAVSPLPDQPLLSASPAVMVSSDAELDTLLRSFPVAVLSSAGSGLTLLSGSSCDVAFEGGFARVAELLYQAPDGTTLIATTIYPARALSLLGREDYTLSDQSGTPVAGMATVRMENASTIRLHVQGEEALYAVTAPRVDAATLSALVRSLQLLTAD